MRPISRLRSEWLVTIHRLGVELRRPPYSAEVARATQRHRSAVTSLARRAVLDGHIERRVQPDAFTSAGIRLTPHALIALGLPMVVYLAWPGFAPQRGTEISTWLGDRGVWASSPYMGRGTIQAGREPDLAAVAMATACRCDAVVCWTDPLLLGRPDVASAHAAGVPVSLVQARDEKLVRDSRDLWSPPLLVPYLPQGRQEN